MKNKLIIFFLVSFTVNSIKSNHRRNSSYEMITFYDQDKPYKLNPYNLEEPYTASILQKLILHTEEKQTLPSNAPAIFETLLTYNGNFIQLPAFIEKKMNAILPDHQPSTKTILSTALQIACKKNKAEYHQKELIRINGSIAKLDQPLQNVQKH